MLQLKPLSKESIPKALRRAEHYRLLNEPWQAESICKDILAVEPNHQLALLNLVLALTDQFGSQNRSSESEARKLCKQLEDNYQRLYYQGLVAERAGKAALRRSTPRAEYIAYEHYRNALDFYAEAEKIHPEDNEDSILRWNSCVRTIEKFNLTPAPNEDHIQLY